MDDDHDPAEASAHGHPASDPLEDLIEAMHISAAGERSTILPDLRRLLARAQERATAQAMAALRPLTDALAGTLDLDEVVRAILDHAIGVAGAERGVLFLGGERDRRLRAAVARSLAGEDVEALGRISLTILQQAAAGQAILSFDALHDARFRSAPSVQAEHIRMVACVPLRAAGRTLGLIYLDGPHSVTVLTEQVRRTLELLAGMAAAAIANARLHGRVLRINEHLRGQIEAPDPFSAIVTVDAAMLDLLRVAAQMARLDHHVLILGESGTGKELVARALHSAGPRAGGQLVPQNCANVPRELAEDLFFGHVRGGFTGAHRARGGLFQRADRGTLFLDEIGELALDHQARLLRVLEDGQVRPVGSSEDVSVDVRVIAATSRDLQKAVATGRFLDALYYRLCVLTLRIPPLRERPGDIPLLVRHFLERHAATAMPAGERVFSREALEYMQALPWPGNVRTLETLVRRVLALAPPGILGVAEVREQLEGLFQTSSAAREASPTPPESRAVAPTARYRAPAAYTYRRPQALRARIEEVLAECAGNRTRAAERLGCHRNTLMRWMRDLGVAD